MGESGVVSCQLCHQPLSEQQSWQERNTEPSRRTLSPDDQSLVEDTVRAYQSDAAAFSINAVFDAEHAAHGITCAACHLRGGEIHAPPQGHTPPQISEANATHRRSVRTPYLETAEFCAECHQFTQRNRAGDKPLQNTYVEWRDSVYGQYNVACMYCHMPDRRHLWRGIHDKDTVQGAIGVELVVLERGSDLNVTATLVNQGAGHMMPTYVTPRLEAHLQLLDANDTVVAQAAYVIQRVVVPGSPWKEISDSRLKPLVPIEFSAAGPSAETRSVRFWIDIDPDHYYRGFYEEQLRHVRDAEAQQLYARALDETHDRRYRIHEMRRAVP